MTQDNAMSSTGTNDITKEMFQRDVLVFDWLAN